MWKRKDREPGVPEEVKFLTGDCNINKNNYKIKKFYPIIVYFRAELTA